MLINKVVRLNDGSILNPINFNNSVIRYIAKLNIAKKTIMCSALKVPDKDMGQLVIKNLSIFSPKLVIINKIEARVGSTTKDNIKDFRYPSRILGIYVDKLFTRLL